MRALTYTLTLLCALCAAPVGASPIDYTFHAVVGDCETPVVGGCLNSWAGQSADGHLTFDDALGTFTAFDFALVPNTSYTWIGPYFPNYPGGPALTWRGSAHGLSATVTFPSVFETFFLDVGFETSLALNLPSLSGGSIRRIGNTNLYNPFASAVATPVSVSMPESSTLLLLGVGLAISGLRVMRY